MLDAYTSGAAGRRERRLSREDACWAPPLSRYAAELTAGFCMPNVPERIEARLVERVKGCLAELRGPSYDERDRVLALSGLLAASVLGLRLPKASSGRTLYEEYDALMLRHGRRTEFS